MDDGWSVRERTLCGLPGCKAAIAPNVDAALLAPAKDYGPGFIGRELQRLKLAALVASVGEWLVLALAAGAPPIGFSSLDFCLDWGVKGAEVRL